MDDYIDRKYYVIFSKYFSQNAHFQRIIQQYPVMYCEQQFLNITELLFLISTAHLVLIQHIIYLLVSNEPNHNEFLGKFQHPST